jgi:hypothetical protein
MFKTVREAESCSVKFFDILGYEYSGSVTKRFLIVLSFLVITGVCYDLCFRTFDSF